MPEWVSRRITNHTLLGKQAIYALKTVYGGVVQVTLKEQAQLEAEVRRHTRAILAIQQEWAVE